MFTTDFLVCHTGSLLRISQRNNPTLAVTTITCVSVCHPGGPVIIRHITACNFSLDGCLFFEVVLDLVVAVALQRLLVPTHVGRAQAILEFVSPDLQVGRR
jgi:hypothetical protein